ncbi:MAG: biotin transporter BioY [Nitrososphaerales archaeon]
MYPKTKGLALSASFAVLLGIFSLVSIPLTGLVPITLQVLGVFLIASLLGPYYGTLSCLIYLMFGALGLPVFHGGSAGIPIILGPTGGYLVSFPIATLVGGSVSSRVAKTRKMDLFRVATGFAISLIIIYALGTFWLMEYLGLTLREALIAGTIPFIGFDILKAIVAAPIAVRLRSTRFDLPVRRPSKATNTIPAEPVPRE